MLAALADPLGIGDADGDDRGTGRRPSGTRGSSACPRRCCGTARSGSRSRRPCSRCSTARSGSRTPTAAAAGARRGGRPSSTPAPERAAAGGGPARRRLVRTSGPRVRQTLAVARNSLAEIAASRWFVVVLLACAGPDAALGLERGRHRLRHVHVAGHAPRRRNGPGRTEPARSSSCSSPSSRASWCGRTARWAWPRSRTPRRCRRASRCSAGSWRSSPCSRCSRSAFMVGGVLIQALQGYYHFELGLYLRILFGLNLADYVLLAALAMTIHVLVNHKYLGHIVVLLAFVLHRWLAGAARHPAPPAALRHRSGLDVLGHERLRPVRRPVRLVQALLGGVGAAAGAWSRSCSGCAAASPGCDAGSRQARARFTGPVARAAGVAIALILALGGFIFYNTNVLNEYRTADEAGAPQAEYEKRYARFEDAAAADDRRRGAARGDLSRRAGRRHARHLPPGEPDRRARSTRCTCSLDPDVEARSISFDRAAEARARGRGGRLPDLRARARARAGRLAAARVRRGVPPARLPEQRDPDGRRRQRHLLRPDAGCRSSATSRCSSCPTTRRASASVSRRGRRMPGPDDAAARRYREPVARRGPRPRRRDRRHGRRPDRDHARRAAPELDGERATLLPLRDRGADAVRRAPIFSGRVRGARGPLERRRTRRSSTTRRTTTTWTGWSEA